MPYFMLEDNKPLYGENWPTEAVHRLREAYRLTRQNLSDAAARNKAAYDAARIRLHQFVVGEECMVFFPKSSFKTENIKFVRPWVKHTIVKQIDDNTFEVQRESGTGKSQVHIVHRNRMKPYFKPGREQVRAPEPEQPDGKEGHAEECDEGSDLEDSIVSREIRRVHPERRIPELAPPEAAGADPAGQPHWTDTLARALFEPRSSRARGGAVVVPNLDRGLEYQPALVRDITDKADAQ